MWIKFRFWLAKLIIGKYGVIANMTLAKGIEIRYSGQPSLIYGNRIIS